MIQRRLRRFWWPTIAPDQLEGAECVVVHEWLTSASGSDKVAAALVEVSRASALICLSARPDVVEQLGIEVPVHQSRLGAWASSGRRWQLLLPLMPLVWGSLDLSGVSTVITSSHSGVNSIPKGAARRICYCHTPVRYGWEWRMERERLPAWARPLFRPGAWLLRRWDRQVSRRVDVFVANSQFIADRIQRCYGRASTVVHPPIDTERFRPAAHPRRDEYLVAGRLVPYKRVDVAVEAATRASMPLVVAGDGPELGRLRALAGPTVRFVGAPDDAAMVELMQHARALLHPGVEDFGMTLVEAQACGTPVIALAAGGALESVDPECSGRTVASTSVSEWADALATFEDDADPRQRRQHALRFGHERFRREMSEVLEP